MTAEEQIARLEELAYFQEKLLTQLNEALIGELIGKGNRRTVVAEGGNATLKQVEDGIQIDPAPAGTDGKHGKGVLGPQRALSQTGLRQSHLARLEREGPSP